MDQNHSDWKQKYLNCLDKLEQKEQSWEELENLLRLAVTRVSLAAEGVDGELDKHLTTLRKSIRAGNHYPGLEAIVEDITKNVKRLDEQRQDSENTQKTADKLLIDLLEQLHFPKHNNKRVKQLKSKLKRADEGQAFDGLLRELATIVNDSVNPDIDAAVETSGANAGFLGRWFGGINNDPDADKNTVTEHADGYDKFNASLQALISTFPDKVQQQKLQQSSRQASDWPTLLECFSQAVSLIKAAEPLRDQQSASHRSGKDDLRSSDSNGAFTEQQVNVASWGENEQRIISSFCLNLLEAIHFPKELDNQVQALRDVVTEGVQFVETGSIIHKIADLVTATRVRVEKEKQELQDFLRQLTERLQDIDHHLLGAEDHRLASLENTKKLDAAVSEQVNDIESSVNEAAELMQLKQSIHQRINTIRVNLEEHRKVEAQYQLQLEKALLDSNSRLRDLEQESQQLRERLNKEHAQAIQDTLTGVFNRLAYEERIEQEYARWKRYQQPLVILVFDIDYFKKINDNYGHKAGDKALRLIAKTLHNNLRESDFLARYGGEEFVVLMPQTKIKAAMGAAEKLREAVQACQFHYQEQRVHITVSCGATEFYPDDSIETAFQRADKALYQAKQNGRNRCESN